MSKRRNERNSSKTKTPLFSEYLWHYTTLDRFMEIDTVAAILPATAFPDREIPAVWFTHLLPSSRLARLPNGSIRFLNRAETSAPVDVMVQIGVPRVAVPHNWETFNRLSGYTYSRVFSHWRCSFVPVCLNAANSVNFYYWMGSGWIRIPEKCIHLGRVYLPDSLVMP